MKNSFSATLAVILLIANTISGCNSGKQAGAVNEGPLPESGTSSEVSAEVAKAQLQANREEVSKFLKFAFSEHDEGLDSVLQIIALPFVPLALLIHAGEEIQYIEQYGTEEEKQELDDLFQALEVLIGPNK